jgi:hypothetical protein
MNMITGVEVGTWIIAPGVLMSENFDITYGLGHLTITPEVLTVTANDAIAGCNGVIPTFTSTNEIYQYECVDSNVVASGPTYTVLDNLNNVVTGSLAPGTYQIVPSNLVQLGSVPNYTVTYVNGTLTVGDSLTATAVEGAIACAGETTTVNITASGGTGPYSGTGAQIAHAGPYSFLVTDALGCSIMVTGTIAEPPILYASSTYSDVACHGGSSVVNVNATGGTPPYSGLGMQTVGVGPFSFIVTDANGCTSTTNGIISQPSDPLTATKTEGTILCAGGNTTVTIVASGGAGFYSGAGVHTVSAGPYSFVVTDINGCTITVSGTISEPSQLVASPTAGTIACFGGTISIGITASGGVGPYAGTGTQIVSAGPYSFIVTDANGCTAEASGTITAPAALADRELLMWLPVVELSLIVELVR